MKYLTICLLLTGCSQTIPAVTCPDIPTTCLDSDVYGDSCYNYSTYKHMKLDVSEAEKLCGLVHIVMPAIGPK